MMNNFESLESRIDHYLRAEEVDFASGESAVKSQHTISHLLCKNHDKW